ncbi:hypothetical protein RclHR1_14320004 [Rhizophagus clarus]|uniref:Uncharacterized protein n=1 Tax=Rhizophagus clarus TaxID=94130 RepID=A0A2Z6QCG5_9GLOM|nr:hypothetical protein RclHR1_14320004 [Rhizophagus clarus]
MRKFKPLNLIPISRDGSHPHIRSQRNESSSRSLIDLSLTISSSSPPASGANNREISELRNMISNLTKHVKVLTKERTSEGPRNRSLSPVLSRENRHALPPITDKNFKKTVHDESINKKLLPAIKAAIPPSLEVYDTELLKVIKQLHKSQWEIWKLKKESKIDEYNKQQYMSSRRDQKMTRRRKGLQHMIFTQDSILDDCHPENMTRESTEDEVLANEKYNDNIRSGRLISTNSVIKIHNKEWRLKESYFEQTRSDKHQNWISSNWIELESDDDDDDEDNNGDNNDDDNNGNDDNNDDDNNGNGDNNVDGNNVN